MVSKVFIGMILFVIGMILVLLYIAKRGRKQEIKTIQSFFDNPPSSEKELDDFVNQAINFSKESFLATKSTLWQKEIDDLAKVAGIAWATMKEKKEKIVSILTRMVYPV